MTVEYPSQIKALYDAWYKELKDSADTSLSTNKEVTDAEKKAFKDFEALDSIVIKVNTSIMKVTGPKDQTNPNDYIIDLTTMGASANTAIIDLVLNGKFTAQRALEIKSTSNMTKVYDITLPENGTAAFDLDVNIKNATVLMQSAGATSINLLTTNVTTDGNKRRGLFLGEGITIDAVNPVTGYVYLDGATIDALALVPTSVNNWFYYEPAEKTGLVNLQAYNFDDNTNGKVFLADKNTTATTDLIKVLSPDKSAQAVAHVTIPTKPGSKTLAPLPKMIIDEYTRVYLYDTNIVEIEGQGSGDKGSWLEFNTNAPKGNIAKVSKVRVTNYGEWVAVNDEFGNQVNDEWGNPMWDLLPFEIRTNFETCAFIADKVSVYPTAVVKNDTFWSKEVYVVPNPQTAENPSYTFTFTGCYFEDEHYLLQLADHCASDEPILDGEGNPVTRTVYKYWYLDGRNNWISGEVFSEDAIPAEAKKLGYWSTSTAYAYYDTDYENAKDYTVKIALDNCSVKNPKDNTKYIKVDKDANIFSVLSDTFKFDVNLRYAINGTTYKPVKGNYDDSLGYYDGVRVILVKE